MKKSKFSGVLPVFQTPYHEDEAIDFGTLEKEVDWLYEKGSDGIVLAMVSEVLRLSSEEREQIATAACHFSKGRGVVIISVGAESGHLAERYAHHAETVGADAVMAIPPISIALSEEELKDYYERILGAISIPVFIQDASGYVGNPMSIELQAGLFNQYSDRVLFKPEAVPIGPRLSALRDATAGKAPIFEGSGGIALVDSFRRGIAGTMPGAVRIDALVALWRALEAGDEKRAYRLSLPLSSLVSLQTSLDGFLAVEKYLLVKRGIFSNTIVRKPVGYTLDEETRLEVDRLFDQLMRAIDQ